MTKQKHSGTLSELKVSMVVFGSLTSLLVSVGNTYYSYFLTNIIHMSATDMGTVMFLSRILSALVIPISSAMLRNVTLPYARKVGKYRAWIITTAPMVAILMALTYIPLDLGRFGSMAYYFLTYFISYCVYSIPEASLMVLMTRIGNHEDTVRISARRALFQALATITYSIATMPIVYAIGKDDLGKGYVGCLLIYGVYYLVGYAVVFLSTKEADIFPGGDVSALSTSSSENEKLSIKEQWSAFISKAHFCYWTAEVIKYISYFFFTGATTYYFTYVIGDLKGITPFLTVFNFIGIAATFIIPPISRRLGVKISNLVTVGGMALGMFFAYFFGQSLISFYIFAGIYRLTYSFTNCVAPLTMVQSSNYYTYKTGKDAHSWIMGMYSATIKIAAALTSGVIGWLLGLSGYDGALAQQTDSVISMIRIVTTLLPGVCALIAFFITLAYPVTNKLSSQIDRELQLRKNQKEEI